jgi:hypothetical protein
VDRSRPSLVGADALARHWRVAVLATLPLILGAAVITTILTICRESG